MRKHKQRSPEKSPTLTTIWSDRIYPREYVNKIYAQQDISRHQRNRKIKEVRLENLEYLEQQIISDIYVSAYLGTTAMMAKALQRDLERKNTARYYITAWDKVATETAFTEADDAAVRRKDIAVIAKLYIREAEINGDGVLRWTSANDKVNISRIYTLDEISILEGDMALEAAERIIRMAPRTAREDQQ